MSRKKNEHFSGYFDLAKIIADYAYNSHEEDCSFSYYITGVMYNNPATIVFWNDGTKTVSKCSGTDVYNPTTGLLLAVLKKFGGSKTSRIIDDWGTTEKGATRVTIKDVRERNKNRLL